MKTIIEQQNDIVHKRNELKLLEMQKDISWIEEKEKEIKSLQDEVISRVQYLIDNQFESET